MTDVPESIQLYCNAAKEHNASDLILHEGQQPIVRITGSMTTLEAPPITLDELREFRLHCRVPEDAVDYDTSFISGAGIRFRVNFHRQLGSEAAVLRRISSKIPDLEEIGVPTEIVKKWALRNSGLVIVAGPTGAAKSTTMAAILEWINMNHERHVVTIEDPVEYIFQRKKALFTQREVGQDTSSFAEGLRRSLRQAPDIIFVGEIRDAETASVVLQAAETGHLVFTTLHASDTGEVMERLSSLFPKEERSGHLQILASQILGVLCQRLLPSVQGGGSMVLACEYLTNIGLTRRCILSEDLPSLRGYLSTANVKESCDFLRSYASLVTQGVLSEEVALLSASNPSELRRRLRGISSNYANEQD